MTRITIHSFFLKIFSCVMDCVLNEINIKEEQPLSSRNLHIINY